MIQEEITSAEVQEFVRRVFPYSSVQPFLLGIVKKLDPYRTASINEAVTIDGPNSYDRVEVEVEVRFDVDKFWNDLAEKLFNA